MDLPTLKHHRGVVKRSFTVLSNYLKTVDKSTVSVSSLKNRRIIAEGHFKRFEELQQSIEESTKDSPDEFDTQVAERDDLEEKYLDIISQIDCILEELSPQVYMPTGHTHAHAHSTATAVKLPRLDLPKFTGKYDEWTSFMDLYESTIHNNTTLSEVQKLQYLKSLVTDEAATLIKNLSVTNSNYQEAWTLLKGRYDNQREIVYSQVRRLFSIQNVKQSAASNIQQLLDTTNECIRALTVLQQPTDQWDTLLVYMTVDKLDSETKRQWALQLSGTSIPTFKQLQDFLEQYIRSLNACTSVGKPTNSNDRKATVSHHSSNSTTNCVLCKETHPIYKCAKFLAFTLKERNETVRKYFLCFNCMKPNHKTVDCKSNSKCRTCNKHHHSLLHFNRSEHQKNEENQPNTSKDKQSNSHHVSNDSDVLLCTALVKTRSHGGEWSDLRILLDGGSQGTLISEECVKALRLQRTWDKTLIKGVGDAVAGYSRGKVSCRLYSKVYNDFIDINALVLTDLTKSMPDFPCKGDWDHLEGVKLADPNYFKKGPIHIILGNEYTMPIQIDGKIRGDGNRPYAVNTIFGWAVGGRISYNGNKSITVNHTHCETEKILKRFWELEEIPQPKYYTQEEKICEEHFVKTHKRDEKGRFCVELPLNDNINKIGYSREIAINRLKQVERRLTRFPEYRQEYNKFMKQAVDLGHMVIVPRGEENEVIGATNYLCHHFVLKPDSTTTKFRVVYDGSANTSTGVSLNDCLLVGPTIQNDIFTLLLKFRLKPVAIKADIEKMFRQFRVSDEHANLQRIVWRDDPMSDVKDYKLVTVTYGTASAPFQATRCLHQLAIENKATYPVAAAKLINEIYVDDLIGCCDNTEEAIAVVTDLNKIASSAGLSFRKWCSNDEQLLETIPDDIKEGTVTFDKESGVKALGVKWNSITDEFCFNSITYESKKKITKRIVLSQLAKVFDPLGIICPVTVNAKLFIQSLWKDQLGWDDPLSKSLTAAWKVYAENLDDIDKITIPRLIRPCHTKNIQLHAFCDSSERAFGVNIYSRCLHDNGDITTHMIAAKSKVAPLKNISLPRLELCGAVLLSELVTTIKKGLELNCDIFAWTDSMIVLQWLASYPGRWQTFVANRVSLIQNLVPFERWNHVKSEENPADIVSRGMSAKDLQTSTLWWNGPQWLTTVDLPPRVMVDNKQKTLEERKAPVVLINVTSFGNDFVSKFSSLFKLRRVFAYVIRFIEYCRGNKVTGELSLHEQNRAILSLLRIEQRSCFHAEYEQLMSKNCVSASSKLSTLNPFIDNDGLMRVGGRLNRSELPMEKKHPIIISANSHLTNLLIWRAHYRNLHGGVKLVLTYLQNNYWIVNAKNKIRFLLRKCVVCRRMRAEKMNQLMGSLPVARVTPGRPFLHTGCDYAGPINLKAMKDARGKKQFKGYFCIFVCMSTKAVHIEAVSDMTTESFIETLRRFVSRRGVPAVMYSDCGTNFAGADNELQRLVNNQQHNNDILTECSQHGIEWRFNPPASPHHGGLWEAGVKSVKYHLRRIIGNRTITFEEFSTILCQVEACLNSRPLLPLSADPDDLDVLTPGHFLVGHPLTALPAKDLTDINMNRLNRWEYTQQCFQHFWKRWHVEYLSSLQQRYKWKCKRENISVGDLVIIHDDNLPPLKWRMGRVKEAHAGVDGLVRVVTLKTASGDLKRPIVKLTPILYNDEQ